MDRFIHSQLPNRRTGTTYSRETPYTLARNHFLQAAFYTTDYTINPSLKHRQFHSPRTRRDHKPSTILPKLDLPRLHSPILLHSNNITDLPSTPHRQQCATTNTPTSQLAARTSPCTRTRARKTFSTSTAACSFARTTRSSGRWWRLLVRIVQRSGWGWVRSVLGVRVVWAMGVMG